MKTKKQVAAEGVASEMGFFEEHKKPHMPYGASAICFVEIESAGVLYLGSTFFFCFSSFFLKLNGK